MQRNPIWRVALSGRIAFLQHMCCSEILCVHVRAGGRDHDACVACKYVISYLDWSFWCCIIFPAFCQEPAHAGRISEHYYWLLRVEVAQGSIFDAFWVYIYSSRSFLNIWYSCNRQNASILLFHLFSHVIGFRLCPFLFNGVSCIMCIHLFEELDWVASSR